MQRRKLPLTLVSLFSVACLTACPAADDSGASSEDDAEDTAGSSDDTTTEGDVGSSDTSTDTADSSDATGTTDTADSSDSADTSTDTDTDTGTDTGETTDGNLCGADPGWGTLAIGEPVKHITALDQTGAEFSLCERAGQPVALDVAAVWCGPCNQVSSFFASGGTDPFGGGLGTELSSLIDDGSILWVTALVQDSNGQATTVTNAAAWDAMYPNANIPVIVEGDVPMIPQYVQLECWPSVFVMDGDLNWIALDDCMTWNHLIELVNLF